MRSSFAIVVCAVLCFPLFAQHRYGSPMNSPAVRGYQGSTNVPPGTGLNGILGSRNPGAGINGLPVLRTNPYRNNCFNCRPIRGDRDRHERNERREGRGFYGGYGYGLGYGYLPLFDSYAFPSSGYVDDQSVQPVQPVQPDPAALALGNEVNRLKSEVDRLKDQQNAVPAQPDLSPSEPAEQPSEPATIIVLRDGRKVESTNYAIMNRTLWNFTAKPVQKIPLSSIDLSASQRANSERGVDFSVLDGGTN